jgi:hypothetical protein
VVDATGKITAGFLEGNFQNLGSMDECLAVTAVEDSGTFTGKYCLVKFKIPVGTSKSNNFKAFHQLRRDNSTLLNAFPSKITALYCLHQ